MSVLAYIANLGTTDIVDKGTYTGLSNIRQTGLYGGYICNPNSYWRNGSTYITGYKSDTNNTSIIFQHKDGEVYYIEVGTPESSDVTEQHAYPTVLVPNSWIYVFQVSGHGRPIDIYKSNLQDDIRGGFTLHHRITNLNEEFGYQQPQILSDGRIIITSRRTGGNSATMYSQILCISNGTDYTSWNIIRTTNADYSTSDVRHYPSTPANYGENNWLYFGIDLRKNTPEICWFGQAFYKTPATGAEHLKVFYSLDETFSKNIETNGAFTLQEFKDNLVQLGSYENDQIYFSDQKGFVLNDVIYGSYFDSSESTWKIYKIDAGVMTAVPISFEGLPTTITNKHLSGVIVLWYNGKNIVARIGPAELFIIADLNLQNIQVVIDLNDYKYDDNYPVEKNSLFPQNLPEIEGDYMIGGGTADTYFPYFTTDDKFLI